MVVLLLNLFAAAIIAFTADSVSGDANTIDLLFKFLVFFVLAFWMAETIFY